eukprot:TRINITY_DN12288_c0_g1_i1.p3 TRINITY_DN12288_c0_g1~~TRINITY_DN12288_c0_g1_i1.p3  ORF type:complete len:383 (+),score=123.87 TRINITY_DN12288_c0_g1_i1:91-1239(+)
MHTLTRCLLRRPKLGQGLKAALQSGYVQRYAQAAQEKADGPPEAEEDACGASPDGWYEQHTPPLAGSVVECALRDWLKLQTLHSARVDRMKTSRQQRLAELDEAAPADPFPLRVAFYQHLLEHELIFLVQGNEAQLFSIDGSQAAMCFFTSMEYVEAFAAQFAAKVVEGGLSKRRVQQVAVNDKGNVVAVNADGDEEELMSTLNGTWQPGHACLGMVRTDDPAAVNRLKVLVNPLSPIEAHIPFLHVARMLDGEAWSLLAGETARVFGGFFEEYCKDVVRAWAIPFPGHPFEGDDEEAAAAGPVVLLVIDTGATDWTPEATDAPHPLAPVVLKIGWGKDHTAELESFLTTFSRLHVHHLAEVPPELVEGAKPFYDDGAPVKS